MSIRPNPAGQNKKIKWGHLQNFKTYVNNASKEEEQLTPEEKRQQLFAAMKPYNSEDYIGKAIFVVGGGGVYDTTPSVSPTPTPTPSITPTSTNTPTPSITPTNTTTPTITPTNTPTSTPTPTNPGSTITFISGATRNTTASSYTITNMPYGGAGLIVIPITSNGNVSVSSVSLGGSSATLVMSYNCSSTNRVSLYQVVMASGSSGDLVITFGSNSTGLDACTYRILGVASNTSTKSSTACTPGSTGNYTLTSLLANSVGLFATIGGAADCSATYDFGGNFGIFQSFKQVAAGTKTCPFVGYGGIVAGIARAWA